MLSEALFLALATVSIQVPEDTEDDDLGRVVTSCESVLGRDKCIAAGPGAAAQWVAVVLWRGDTLTITLHTASGAPFVARTELDFSPQDDASQRWVASGLMVAALAAGQPRPSAPPPKPPPPPPVRAPQPPVPNPPPRGGARGSLWASVGALTGSGPDSGEFRWGGQGRLGWTSGLGLGLAGGWRVASRSENPRLTWVDGSLGLFGTTRTPQSPFSLQLGGEGVLQSAQARATQDGNEAVAHSLRAGVRAWAGLSLRLSPAIDLWAAADVTSLRPRLEVRLNSQTVDREAPTQWALGSGLRFELFRAQARLFRKRGTRPGDDPQ